jgi:membrane-associated protein
MEIIHWLIEILRDPGELIAWGGYPGLALVIFLETGAMVFFLPGDSLLVVAGLYAAQGSLHIGALNALLIPMAILGDACSYAIGVRAGPLLFNRPRSRWFNPAHLRSAHGFYERHGGKAIVLARFAPILRTFVPVVAGVGSMGYRRFAAYNALGGIGWVASMTLTGYFLGMQFPAVVRHLEKVILIVVALSILPTVLEYARARRRARGAA